MSEISACLNQLIDVAERTLCCRQKLSPPDFEEFAAEVRAIQPPVGTVLSEAPRNLIAVLACLWQSPEPQRPVWMTVVAALLQLVRNDLSQVIEARRRPLEPDTTYRTGGGMPRDERRFYRRW
jgi:hypothetical protein